MPDIVRLQPLDPLIHRLELRIERGGGTDDRLIIYSGDRSGVGEGGPAYCYLSVRSLGHARMFDGKFLLGKSLSDPSGPSRFQFEAVTSNAFFTSRVWSENI